jgi:hypothetical protein
MLIRVGVGGLGSSSISTRAEEPRLRSATTGSVICLAKSVRKQRAAVSILPFRLLDSMYRALRGLCLVHF